MTRAIGVRRGTAADIEAIRTLTRAAYAKWIGPDGREPTPMTADYAAAVRAHRFDLLYAEDALAGLIETVDEGEILLIENVAVAPADQGRGLGTKLLALADEIARTEGKRRIRLYTNKCWTENIRLYQRLGFQIDREEDVRPGLVRVHMSKAVA